MDLPFLHHVVWLANVLVIEIVRLDYSLTQMRIVEREQSLVIRGTWNIFVHRRPVLGEYSLLSELI